MKCLYTTSNSRKPNFVRHWPTSIALGLYLILAGNFTMANELATDRPKTDVVVYKTPHCGCCNKWIEHLRDNNFSVKVNLVSETNTVRARLGVPQKMVSCHTAVVGDYWVEGHVPADLIHKLLNEQPADIRGIAAPGMPQGSPGMESTQPTKYQVLSVNAQGHVDAYATRDGHHVH